MKTGIEIIAAERKRQIEVENYTDEHDNEHAIGELANAASCYAMIPELRPAELPPAHWPWLTHWKPTPENRIKELAKAGALIAAEIDRLQRKDYLSKVEHVSLNIIRSPETEEVLRKIAEEACKGR